MDAGEVPEQGLACRCGTIGPFPVQQPLPEEVGAGHAGTVLVFHSRWATQGR